MGPEVMWSQSTPSVAAHSASHRTYRGMEQWRTYVTLIGTRRVIISLIISLSLGMIPLTLVLVKNELIERAGETVALGAADIADKLDLILAERLGDIQAFAQSSFLTKQDQAEILAYLGELQRIYPMYRRLSLIDRDGHLIASTEPANQAVTGVSLSMMQATMRHADPQIELILRPNHSGGGHSTPFVFRPGCSIRSRTSRASSCRKSTRRDFASSSRKPLNGNRSPRGILKFKNLSC